MTKSSIVRGCEIQDQKTDLESPPEVFYEGSDESSPLMGSIDPANLMRVLQHLEAVAKPRIAIKAKGKILFLDVAEIVAVQAEGNYICLKHRAARYLARESLSSITERLKPYGFVRIARSVIVNISAVHEVEPLSTGEYRLRMKGGLEYLATRTYKNNLRNLAQLWIRPARLCS